MKAAAVLIVPEISRRAQGQPRGIVSKTTAHGATVVAAAAAIRGTADLLNSGPLVDHEDIETVVDEGDVLDPQQPDRYSPAGKRIRSQSGEFLSEQCTCR